MTESILDATKKALGLEATYTPFDPELVMFINGALSTLTQIGVGPSTGFRISGPAQTWDELLGNDPNLDSAKSLVYMKVRLVFDPPGTSFLLTAIQEQIREEEWRLNVYTEGLKHPLVVVETVVDWRDG